MLTTIKHSCSCFIKFIKIVAKKRDKMLVKPRILCLFLNLFYKLNKTGALMYDPLMNDDFPVVDFT